MTSPNLPPLRWALGPRQLADFELLATGAFHPLAGFLGERDYRSVCDRMRLADGGLWPVPVVLDLPEELASRLATGGLLELEDPEGMLLGRLTVEECFRPDREAEAEAVYGTTDRDHPGVAALLASTHPFFVAGPLEIVALPEHHDFRELRLTPAQLRRRSEGEGWPALVAFQTRNPIHRAHFELTSRAARETGAHLLLHPVVGLGKPGDLDHFTRVRSYQAILPRYPSGSTTLALLPLAMRMAGPREALWHALIRRNFGCTHLVVGRDHAGPGVDRRGSPFYLPYAAQELVRAHAAEIGVAPVLFPEMVYLPEKDRFASVDDIEAGEEPLSLSGSELRRLLRSGEELPGWFTFPEVARELAASHPPRRAQGFAILFTGLSGAGKSTLARALQAKLLERGGRPVTLLDGDLVRRHLSSELGFSRRDRDINVRRIGWVASEIVKNGGIALCAPIAPYDATRREVRALVSERGGFGLVFVATPLPICEQRDRKGLYAKARAGEIPEFTGISDPYEEPADAELRIDTGQSSVEQGVGRILAWLEAEGYLPSAPPATSLPVPSPGPR
jgi:sulfate adenylyltransferase